MCAGEHQMPRQQRSETTENRNEAEGKNGLSAEGRGLDGSGDLRTNLHLA